MPKTYIVGNWKMNQTFRQLNEFFKKVDEREDMLTKGSFWIAPQSVHIFPALQRCNSNSIKIGAQNCSDQVQGAYTGEISPQALKELDVHFVILGHSERRAYYDEEDSFINRKVKAALESQLVPILCVGETLAERESGKALDVVLNQVRKGLKNVKIKDVDDVLIAYEPVWAIGTGETATPEQAEEVHAAIREELSNIFPAQGQEISILYGGSVKPGNIKELLAQKNINGGLVGGASLKAEDFIQLCEAAI